MLGEQAETVGVVRPAAAPPRGRAASRRPGRHPGEGAPARRGEPARAVLTDRATTIVERAELGEVRRCLLEVVAEDLLELGRPVAVHAVGPGHEPLVEVGPGALEDAVVRGVADHDVLEAVESSSSSSTLRTRCFWASVVSSVLTRGDTSAGSAPTTAASANT